FAGRDRAPVRGSRALRAALCVGRLGGGWQRPATAARRTGGDPLPPDRQPQLRHPFHLHRRRRARCGARGRAPARLSRRPLQELRGLMDEDPHALFDAWLAEARAGEPNDPEAMALATADASGAPSVRMVLLKGHDARGFVFYTNSRSRKGGELGENPRAALLFPWKSLRRQVRIEGPVEPVSDEEADAYFATRARASQLGAWASDQSRPLESRALFEARYEAAALDHEGREVPRPPHWKGYRVKAERIEFWRDRPHRLRERRLFVREGEGWRESLLFP